MRGVARYDEIRQFWDIDEVYRALEHLDVLDDLEWLKMKDIPKPKR
jgi:hypothetical protein